ncbi:MAG: TSUP family transporter [Alteromonadaceae bacterium]|nr:TSUP family transporter [Alteromonadaceae bacterium]
MNIELLLGFIALCTSIVAGVFGFGGGMLLIAILPVFLPPSLLIPIHGITQLASNSSRMLFSLTDVKWSLLPKFFIGSLVGTLLFGYIIYNMPTTYLPLAIGLYILLNLWSPDFSKFMRRFESYYVIGFSQTGLGLIVGATGPLSLSILTKQLQSKDEIIATSSLFMTISHLAKIPVFLAIGAALLTHLNLIVTMVLGSVLGSYVGTKLRLKADNDKLVWLIKILLTLLAIHMIANVFW